MEIVRGCRSKLMEVVNVVGSGSLNTEFDLRELAAAFNERVKYDPERYPGAYFRFCDSGPLITLYRTGKYIVTGAGSEEEAHSLRDQFLGFLAENGVIESPDDEWFSLQNFVCTAEFGRSLDLATLAIGLGLECTEYEPEQFPGLVYRPPGAPCVALLFATGKAVLTGCPDLETAEDTFTQVRLRVEKTIPK